MKVNIQTLIMFFSLLLLSCNNKPSSSKEESISTSNKQDTLDADLSIQSKQVVLNFYNWYINDIYLKHIYDYDHAPYKKYGSKYGLDIEAYKDKLNKVKYFSISFKEDLINKNIECNKAMLNADLSNFDPEYDADFTLESDEKRCNCLWNNEWFGNQEDENSKFTILDKIIKEGTSYIYFVQNYIEDTPAFIFKVKTVLEGGEYKIASINRQ